MPARVEADALLITAANHCWVVLSPLSRLKTWCGRATRRLWSTMRPI